jgi:hypothetical protein
MGHPVRPLLLIVLGLLAPLLAHAAAMPCVRLGSSGPSNSPPTGTSAEARSCPRSLPDPGETRGSRSGLLEAREPLGSGADGSGPEPRHSRTGPRPRPLPEGRSPTWAGTGSGPWASRSGPPAARSTGACPGSQTGAETWIRPGPRNRPSSRTRAGAGPASARPRHERVPKKASDVARGHAPVLRVLHELAPEAEDALEFGPGVGLASVTEGHARGPGRGVGRIASSLGCGRGGRIVQARPALDRLDVARPGRGRGLGR